MFALQYECKTHAYSICALSPLFGRHDTWCHHQYNTTRNKQPTVAARATNTNTNTTTTTKGTPQIKVVVVDTSLGSDGTATPFHAGMVFRYTGDLD